MQTSATTRLKGLVYILQQHRGQALIWEKNLVGQLFEWRKTKGLTSKELAKALDISPQYLSDIENGRRAISDNLLCKIQKIVEKD